ncbi:Hsp70 family protein [Actinomycetospora cinnamomea]|uniref:Hsp70 protein n=1 Tax=Actinomycetospora cinnamomea TaxID=663609 RepID=A0A2U1FPV5_9PSEU|nr:Hsp70 family protein [Actinomycetospora cinnamomea]PVZ14184.1 Hsp70 protein [Actinomycetospora cinnamomea]
MTYSLGIDLGTTFVAAAISRDGQRVEMVPLGDRTVTEPALVLRRPDGSLAVGDAAARQAGSRPADVAWGVKRRLGDPTPVVLGGASRPAGELLAAMLRDVLARVAAEEGGPPERVVLTHPANWGPYRRGLFEDVAVLAGLEDPPMLTEPEAAGVHFAITRGLAEGDLLGVYDLGGGTFDAAVLRGRAAGVEILGVPEGMEHLGGVDFDEAVLDRVDQACGGAVSELDPHDARARAAVARVRQDCVVAKETLSVDDQASVAVLLPTRQEEVTVTRAEFEAMVRTPLESTVAALRRALDSAGVRADALSAVLLVGGSSRIPLVGRMVGDALGCRTVVDSHPKHAVALGAAVVAARGAGAVGAGWVSGDARAAARPTAGGAATAGPATPAAAPATAAPPPTVVHSPDPVAATRALPRDAWAARPLPPPPASPPAALPGGPAPGRGGPHDSGYHPRPAAPPGPPGPPGPRGRPGPAPGGPPSGAAPGPGPRRPPGDPRPGGPGWGAPPGGPRPPQGPPPRQGPVRPQPAPRPVPADAAPTSEHRTATGGTGRRRTVLLAVVALLVVAVIAVVVLLVLG